MIQGILAFISLLAEAGVDDRLVKTIVGHKGQGVTQQIYTHFEIQAPFRCHKQNISKGVDAD